MNDLYADLIDDGIDGAGYCSGESQCIGTGGQAGRRRNLPAWAEFFQRDHKEAKDDETDSQDSLLGKDFSNEKYGPQLSENRSRARNGIDQGEVSHPIGLNQADKIDGFKETREDDDPPKLGRGLEKKGWECSHPDQYRKIEKNAPEKNPEKKFDGPVPFLRNKVPGGMKNG